MFLIWSLGSVPLTCTPRPGGSSGSIMICMSGDALSMFWRRRLRTARVFQGGSQDLFAASTWVSPRNIQALSHLSSTLTLGTSLLSFTLSLMIGLQLWLPMLMLFQTSTPIVGPDSLVIRASSSHLMRPMKSTKRLQGMTPTLLKSWRATRLKLLQQWTKIRQCNHSQFHHSLSLS